ncbi:hypothetical protein ACJA3J_05650 [Halobacillus sp. SY10]|uniref:hypothetical protein n=1 Tax=Halobacillus sp. SY10 TaxID=3381356 RepID=UPI00387A12B4
MCEICHGRGVRYDYDHSATYVNPCPNAECRLAAQERSKKEIKRLKAGLAKQKEVSA